MAVDRELYRLVDYIMNRASAKDLDVIRAALGRRERDSHNRISPGNIRGMAHDLAATVSSQLEGIGDVKDIALRYVREMLRRAAPSLPEEHLELILQEWVPSREAAVEESRLPRDVVRSMVVQFVDYSLGRMPASQKAELKPEWSRRYWAVFSERTRGLIRNLLTGGLDEQRFWISLDEEEG